MGLVQLSTKFWLRLGKMLKLFNKLTTDEDKLMPEEELANLKSFVLDEQNNLLYNRLISSLDVLQSRSQMLLSLVTISLTITGFSGPQIARSSGLARDAIIVGLIFVLMSAFILLFGPLRLSWVTRINYEDSDQVLLRLIRARNKRTARFHAAGIVLVIGLISYTTSVIAFLMTGLATK